MTHWLIAAWLDLAAMGSSQDGACIYIMPEVPSKVIGLDAARDKYQITHLGRR